MLGGPVIGARVWVLAALALACATPPPPRARVQAAAALLRLPAETVVATWAGGRLTYGELDRSLGGELGRSHLRAMETVRSVEQLVLRERLGARAGLVVDLPPATAAPGPSTRVVDTAVVARWSGGSITYRELDEGRHGALASVYRGQLAELGSKELGAIDTFLRRTLGAEAAPAWTPVTEDEAKAFHARVLAELGVPAEDDLRGRLDADRRERAETEAWRRRQDAAGVAILLPPPAALRAPFALAGRPHRGSPGAPLTIIEATDLACAPCAEAGRALEAVEAMLPGLIQTYALSLPTRFDRAATLAAIAAECAHEQRRYWAYRHGLEDDARPRTDETLVDAARTAGLDLARFDACRARPDAYEQVQRDVAQAEGFGARSIPAFFVNGLVGPARAPTREELERVLRREPQGPGGR